MSNSSPASFQSFSFPAESQVERSSRGLALILRDKENQRLEKCLIPVLKPVSPYPPKTLAPAFLPDPSQAVPCAAPLSAAGQLCFPTQLVTPRPAPRDTEEKGPLKSQAGWCHSHSHRPWPFNTTSTAGSGPSASDRE